MSHYKIAVIGSGSWGTALAIHLSRLGHNVSLWGNNESEQLRMIESNNNYHYLDDPTPFPSRLKVEIDLATSLQNIDGVLVAVPSNAFVEVLERLSKFKLPRHFAYATKGMIKADIGSGEQNLLISKYLAAKKINGTVISGPTFAKEVASGMPTTLVVANSKVEACMWWLERMHGKKLRAYAQTDVVGVEIGGAIKNIVAIAVGMSDGLDYGANARAGLITRGLAEIIRLAEKMGAKTNTLTGLAGLGDLVLTSTDDQSRNRRLGLLLAKGKTKSEACKIIGQVVEGIEAVKLTFQISQELKIDMPITKAVFDILESNQTIEQAIANLFSRKFKNE